MLNFRIISVVVTTILCAIRLYADPPGTLTMTVNPSTVTISGATPHGKVVFFGVGRFVNQTTVTVRRLDKTVTDDDGDGIVTIDIGAPVPWKSIFAAVDFSSGRYVLSTPNTGMFPLLPLLLDSKPLVADSQGVLRQIVVRHRVCEMLHVRPGVGAWGQLLADGNKFDTDLTSNGRATANVAGGVGLGEGTPAAPSSFEPGDVVVLIDRQRMESWATTVGSQP